MKYPIKHRNNSYADWWSITHFIYGAVLGWIMNPFFALVIMVLWEPIEIFILSPLLAKAGIVFGYESVKNSLSDIVFDILGVVFGAYIISQLFSPPFHLF